MNENFQILSSRSKRRFKINDTDERSKMNIFGQSKNHPNRCIFFVSKYTCKFINLSFVKVCRPRHPANLTKFLTVVHTMNGVNCTVDLRVLSN